MQYFGACLASDSVATLGVFAGARSDHIYTWATMDTACLGIRWVPMAFCVVGAPVKPSHRGIVGTHVDLLVSPGARKYLPGLVKERQIDNALWWRSQPKIPCDMFVPEVGPFIPSFPCIMINSRRCNSTGTCHQPQC
jgi:hypothetical protein